MKEIWILIFGCQFIMYPTAQVELFSYEKYSFPALEMLVCRYYGYVPRVIIWENTIESK